jgi:signal transduction histidine kinase
MKVCLYRFAQEGLSNAFRHADGRGQTIRAGQDGGTVFVEVADLGPGIPQSRKFPSTALGLRGLRNRVESLGGSLELTAGQPAGTRLAARFKYHKEGIE